MTQSDISSELDEILSPQIMNNDTCFECNINFKEAKQAIQKLITKAKIEETENLLSHAREHTITDIEMIMHHTQGKVDFIEAVKTDILTTRLTTLKKSLQEDRNTRSKK